MRKGQGAASLPEKKHLIVGLDPGTTTGVAVLGLDGLVLSVHSSRTMNLKDLIHLVIGHGYPLIVATDVAPAPAFVEKVCRLFEAVLYQPTHSLTVEEKRELAKRFESKFGVHMVFKNSHEKDAFAAAAKALEGYGDKFRWIDRKLGEKGLEEISERVKSMVVTGQSLSNSLAEILDEKKPPEPARQVVTQTQEPSQAVARARRTHRIESAIIKNMEHEILDLKTQVKEQQVKIQSLQNELEKARSDGVWEIVRSKEVDSRNKMIMELKRSLSRVAEDRERLRGKISEISGSGLWRVADKLVLIPILQDLSKRTVAGLRKDAAETPFLVVRDPSGTASTVAKMLADAKVECVVAEKEFSPQAASSLEDCGIAVVPMGRASLILLGNLALGEKASLNRLLEKERRRLSRRASQIAAAELKKYVDDYRRKITSQK